MFGHRSFLMIGSSAADIDSLVKGGLEIVDCNFGFQQAVDAKGKATTKVYGGVITLTIAQLPTTAIIEWALNSRKYQDGTIAMLDSENLPLEKVLFKNAACVSMDVDYTGKGDNYASTKLVIQAEKVTVGNGIEFDNEWNS